MPFMPSTNRKQQNYLPKLFSLKCFKLCLAVQNIKFNVAIG